MNCRIPITTAAYRADLAGCRRAERNAPFCSFRRLLDALACWRQRSRQRTALAALDDRLLDDVGLSRDDVAREIHKPFWQM